MEIGDLVESIIVMLPNCEIKTLKKEEISFTYRSSSLNEFIVLEATLNLVSREDKNTILKEIEENIGYRRKIQEYRYPNVGSIFKNPLNFNLSAGEMIDRCGLKGFRVGDAQISDIHANFIINLGSATAYEVREVIKTVKKKVKDRFAVNLEEEVRYVGD